MLPDPPKTIDEYVGMRDAGRIPSERQGLHYLFALYVADSSNFRKKAKKDGDLAKKYDQIKSRFNGKEFEETTSLVEALEEVVSVVTNTIRKN